MPIGVPFLFCLNLSRRIVTVISIFNGKLPEPQWLLLRGIALLSAHVIGKIAPTLSGWQQWLAYAGAGCLLIWALGSLLLLARKRWRVRRRR